MNWKYIFNPFIKFDDRKLLVAGLAGFILLNIVCVLIATRMNGILHFENTENGNLQNILIVNLGIMLSAIVVFFFYGKIINKNTRFIDVANVFLLSTIPSSFVLLWGKIPIFERAAQNLVKIAGDKSNLTAATSDLIIVTMVTMVALPMTAYVVILIFNGFRTATNMKKTWQIIAFIIILFALNATTQTFF